MATTMNTDWMNDSYKTATETFANAMQAGVKMNEEMTRFWMDWTQKNTEQFRDRMDTFTEDFTPIQKKNVERFSKFFDENSRRTMGLVRESFGMATVKNPADFSTKMGDFYRNSAEFMRDTMGEAAKLNNEAFEDFVGLTQGAPERKATTRKAGK